MKTVSLAFNSEKDAALYFDKVIPVNFNEFVNPERFDANEKPALEIIKELLPDEYKINVQSPKSANEIFGIKEDYYDYYMSVLNPRLYALTARKFDQAEYERMKDDCIKRLIHFIKDEYAIVDSDVPLTESADGKETCVRLVGLQLIDTSKASWEQILEIRRDKASLYKLRKLRLFFEDTCVEKDENYIRDVISVYLEDYKAAAKSFGFDLATKTISFLAPIATIATTFVFPLLQKQNISLQEIINASVPMSMELGGAALQILRSKYDWHGVVSNNPCAYIADVNKKLSKT